MNDSRDAPEVIGDCVVRPAIDSDLLGLLQLFSRADEGIRPEVSSSSTIDVSTWHTMLTTENLTVYVAERSGQIVGSVTFMVMPHLSYECRPRGFIEAMVVTATHRRSGVGRRLMERVLADASGAGCHKIQLLAHKRHASDGAHNFYRSLGFEAEAEGFRLYLP